MTTDTTTAAPLVLAAENPGPPPLLAVTIPEAGRISGLGRNGIIDLIANRKLRLVVIGKRRVVPFDELRRVVLGAA